jgi:choline dehydrogenase-like flavoprotein
MTDDPADGRGCGGEVAAKYLAEAGCRVLAVEKSCSYSSDAFPIAPNEGFRKIFGGRKYISTDDESAAILPGSTWSGGTVSWSTSQQTQVYVR